MRIKIFACDYFIASLVEFYRWLLPMAIRRVFRDWIQESSCSEGVVVRLNREFVHTAQLGANHLKRTQLHGKE